MVDYEAYRNHVGITNAEMTKILHGVYTHYSKIIASCVNQPAKYGICLHPDAEHYLAGKCGYGPGLAHLHYEGKVPEKFRKDKPYRKKDKRITVWLTGDMLFRLISLKTRDHYPTMQSLAEAALEQFIERETNEIPSA